MSDLTAMADPILMSIEDTVATVILNNPDRRNAVSLGGWKALARTMTELSADTSLRCIVIRGAGDKAFSAGADIAEFPDLRADAAQARLYGDAVADALSAVTGCIHPIVAAIQGACTGGGLEIASGCDIRIANASARFGVPINRLGHSFAYAEMQTVLAAAGRTLILEMILEGRILDASEALSRGLVNRVVADAGFDDEIQATVERISSGAPLTNRTTKRFLKRLKDPAPLTEADIEDGYALCDTEDYAEGMRAFLAKEKPSFEGK